MQKLILHIPHSSLVIPDEYRDEFIISDEALMAELFAMTDVYTDELFPCGYERIVFPVSRLVCDPERFREDESELMSDRGMGAVYTHGSCCRQIRVVKNREAILKNFYDPHHRALERTVLNVLEHNCFCCIVDCHSFSGVPLPYEVDQNPMRPDICIGTDDYHTPPEILLFTKNFFENKGYHVAVNRPYEGTIVPMVFYKKDRRVKSIMIEINRALYMGDNGKQTEGYYIMKRILAKYCKLLSEF